MAGTTHPEVVLITGCSSGIGRAAATRLHEAGLRVYATARRVGTVADLASRGIHTLALDVTDEPSMTRAVAAVEADAGAVSVLINNAGYGLYGPVEQQPMAEIRRQFETNFFGLLRLTQLVLPGMRRRRGGRILNISSMGGRATLPGGAVITHAVTTPRPRTRYLINPVAKSVVAMNRLLPGRAYDAVLRLQYRLPH